MTDWCDLQLVRVGYTHGVRRCTMYACEYGTVQYKVWHGWKVMYACRCRNEVNCRWRMVIA